MQFNSLWELTEYMMRDKYLVNDSKFNDVLDKRRTYKPGEISETTGLQKQPDGSWAEPRKGNQSTPAPRTLSAETRIKIRGSQKDPSAIKMSTPSQKKSLEKVSCSVDVSSIDAQSIKVVDNTVKALIKQYKMRPLEYIKSFKGDSRVMAKTDGNGILLNEDFFNNPSKYYNDMVASMKEAQSDYSDFRKKVITTENPSEYERTEYNIFLDTIRANVLYEGKEVECVTIHEMAHVLCQQKIQMYNIDKTPEAKKLGRLVLQTYFNAMETGDINTISYYARKNRKEFFAEAFVMYKLNKEKLPDYITHMIEEVVK